MRSVFFHALTALGFAGALARQCASKPASPHAAVSQVLAYQDSSGGWSEDTTGIKLPALKHRVSPGVPERSEQVSGAVLLKALVTARGTVDQATVTKSLSRAMDEEAVKAVRQWTYSPATRSGEPVAIWMTVTVTYHFNG